MMGNSDDISNDRTWRPTFLFTFQAFSVFSCMFIGQLLHIIVSMINWNVSIISPPENDALLTHDNSLIARQLHVYWRAHEWIIRAHNRVAGRSRSLLAQRTPNTLR